MKKYLLALAIFTSSIGVAENKQCCGSQIITSVSPCGVCSKKEISVCVPECTSCCSSCCDN
ncbi:MULTISPECIES: hypothetical protein [Holospora]|uniref:Uncharacterized protein n=2 Tax=Holospora TaxID=44747 RepID=A0A061JFY6_9PROT|nr:MULTISPECIES: hypothetical protein [Holospora]ETZ04655.1 hypothetical protein K737_300930 [Holospora undulata HU1]GAJ46067.1 hypothetical protein HE1_00388 [Holospora elegans E1]